MTDTILFDLGNTLVRYYEMRDFPSILRVAITGAADAAGVVPDNALWERVAAENFESPDCAVRSLEGRLRRILVLSELEASVYRAFMSPIFALAAVYADALPTLAALHDKGCRTAVVSNTPWGSPAALWREELARLGLAGIVDCVVFCDDCGWRKPARQIFDHTLSLLNVKPQQCLFIGDDPRWDIAGPEALGIRAALIQRPQDSLPNLLRREGVL